MADEAQVEEKKSSKRTNAVTAVTPVEVFGVTADLVDPTGLPTPGFVPVALKTRNFLALKIGSKISFLNVEPMRLPDWVGEAVAKKVAAKDFSEPKTEEKAGPKQV